MKGLKKLTKKQIEVLREMVDFTCQGCGLPEEAVGTLQPHRIRPGCEGGLYVPNNIKMVCSDCHGFFSAAQRIANGSQS